MEYHFFWRGPLSQWYKSPFKYENIVFNCCEQWMMYKKAMLFSDYETAKKILESKSPGHQKKLGREVLHFKEKTWKDVRMDVVVAGNLLKFEQNPELGYMLLETGDKILVEASPYDRIWGIGYDEETAKKIQESYWGQNLLGQALMKVRDYLKGEIVCL